MTEFIGRLKSERQIGPGRRVYRNGHGKIRNFGMLGGTIQVRRPRIRNSEERFESRIIPLFHRKSKELGAMLPELYLHGLAKGDFPGSRVSVHYRAENNQLMATAIQAMPQKTAKKARG